MSVQIACALRKRNNTAFFDKRIGKEQGGE